MMTKYFIPHWFFLLGTLLINSITASGQARLVLNGGMINITQGAYLVIDNPASNAITVNSGFIISEGENNTIKWNIGTTTGSYTIPWGYSATYIPINFTKTAGIGSGHFLFSTYHTGWQNSTQLPTAVTNMNGASGTDNSAFASDRFWQINAQGYSTKPTLSNLVLTYIDAENATTNNTITESNLKAYRFNPTLSSWTDNILASAINTISNTVTVTSVGVSDLQPWWVVGTLGANRYWVAPSSSTSNLSSNWSASSGGPGNAGVPTLVDVMIYDGSSTAISIIDANVSAANLLVTPAYSGIISQGTSTITLSNTATLSGGTFIGGSVDMMVGGTFTLSGSSFTSTSATLELKKDFAITSGSFAHNNGTVKFSGTDGVTQQVTGTVLTSFKNISLTNTAATPGLRMESNQNLVGVLTLASNAVMDADGVANSSIFKLLSRGDDPTLDASINILPSGAQVTGNVTVQRFMTIEGHDNTRIYRFISSPIQNAQVADIQNEIPITGSFTGTSLCGTCLTNQSMFSYNESVTTDTNTSGSVDLNDGYIDFPDISNTEILVPGKGYAMFVRGNILSSALWDVRGPINVGNVTPVSLPVSYASSGNILNDGWNLVGNPLPSTVDWNAPSGWTKTNLGASIYIPDNGNTSLQYATWNGTTGTNGGSRYIAIGQGFWTKADGSGTPVLQANEDTKASGTQATFFREGSLDNLLRVTMTNGATRDEAVIHFREDATSAFDTQADAWKLQNELFNVSSLSSNNEKLAINSWSALLCGTSIKLSVTESAIGAYFFMFTNLDSFTNGEQFILNDQFMNESITISENSDYLFNVTTDSRSHDADRFVLQVNKEAPPLVIQTTSDWLSVAYTENIQWYFNDNLITGATAPSIKPDLSGIYSVIVNYNGCNLKGSIEFLVTAIEQSLAEEVFVYPNPVTNDLFVSIGKIKIQSITLLNSLGEIIKEVQFSQADAHSLVEFNMEKNASGVYFLKIIADKNIFMKKVVKK